MDEPRPGDDEQPRSRAALKREMLALQALGRELVALPAAAVAALPLGERCRAAVEEGRRLVPRALARHLRHLAKLLGEEDIEALRRALDEQRRPHQLAVAAFHRAERWRDQLLAGEMEAIEEILSTHPAADRQRLRQLARNAQRAAARGEAAASAPARALFRAIAELQRGGGG